MKKKDKTEDTPPPRAGSVFERMFTLGWDGPTPDIHDLMGIIEDEVPWSVLGFKGPVARKKAEAAYRRLSRKYHPDLGGSHDKMATLTEAWSRIKESEGW